MAVATFASLLLAACGGGGEAPPPPGGGTPTTVTISGQITFDRIPFDATVGNGLNPAGTTQAPARQVTVQAIAGTQLIASTTTDTSGNYSLSVPVNTNLFIRARAEMVKTDAAPTWNFSVRNNTTAGNNDALYALDGTTASSGTANSTRNLNAPSGFGTTSYTGERAAAPFAILDTVYQAKQLILSAVPTTAFPELRLFWSKDNRPTAGRFCPDDGDIGTSSYIVFPQGDVDDCNQSNADGIYILGDFSVGDTDEFDQSVIAHEFGHYIEDRFSRSDSIGGEHGGSDTPLDLRVAFGEGWGNAFSAMTLGNPIYRDSSQGTSFDFQIDMETDDPQNEGWFSEASVEEILWDLFDSANEPGDGVALGFAPIYSVMTGAQVTTDALTSIYSFITGLRATAGAPLAAIDNLLDGEKIFGTDAFGAAETNDGGDADILPVYKTLVLNTPISVCSRSPFGNTDTNKLGNRVFLRFDNNAARLVTIRADGAANGGGTTFATDPDIFVLRKGALVTFSNEEPSQPPPHTLPGHETISQFQLAAGTYIIEVYDFDLDQVAGATPRCMTVSIQG
ncbi:MAG TPA: hypothetical protein VJQ52_16505 [Steroidobacteraceae bacterium]|nr:hypothetical protein [Steroidobacteraceae bacterium]